jgi:hypothetical protein
MLRWMSGMKAKLGESACALLIFEVRCKDIPRMEALSARDAHPIGARLNCSTYAAIAAAVSGDIGHDGMRADLSGTLASPHACETE